MQGKVEISGVNTAKLKTLKNDEMVRLMKLAKAGDEQARQALIEGNLRLVLSVIQRFVGRAARRGIRRRASASSREIFASCCRSSSAFSAAGRIRTTCFRLAALAF